MNNKYFTPITELPGDSGKSESAAAMVRYNRSTSPHKYAKNQPKQTQKDEYFQKIMTVEQPSNSMFTPIASQQTIKKSATVASQNKYASQFTDKYAPQKSNVIAKSMSTSLKKSKKIKKNLSIYDDTIEGFYKLLSDVMKSLGYDVSALKTGTANPDKVGEELLRRLYGDSSKKFDVDPRLLGTTPPTGTTATGAAVGAGMGGPAAAAAATSGIGGMAGASSPKVSFDEILKAIIRETNILQGRSPTSPFRGFEIFDPSGAYNTNVSNQIATILKDPTYNLPSINPDEVDARNFALNELLMRYQDILDFTAKVRKPGESFIIGDAGKYPVIKEVSPGLFVRVNPEQNRVSPNDLSYRNILGTYARAYIPGLGMTRNDSYNTILRPENLSNQTPSVARAYQLDDKKQLLENINDALAQANTPREFTMITSAGSTPNSVQTTRDAFANQTLGEAFPWFQRNAGGPSGIYRQILQSANWGNLIQDYPASVRTATNDVVRNLIAGSKDAEDAAKDLLTVVLQNERNRIRYTDDALQRIKPGSPWRTAVQRKVLRDAAIAGTGAGLTALGAWWLNSGKNQKPDQGVKDEVTPTSTPTPSKTPEPTKIPKPSPTPTPTAGPEI